MKRRLGFRPRKELSLKQKLLGTGLILLFYRLFSAMPLPFVDSAYVESAATSFGFLNLLTGGSLEDMSLMALGIGPYITASIVIQLLGIAIPALGDLRKDASGKEKLKWITVGSSVGLALIEALGMMAGYRNQGILTSSSWTAVVIPSLLLMLGSGALSLAAWLIDDRFFGNGTSLILTAGILCYYVSDGTLLAEVITYGKDTGISILLVILAAVLLFLLFLYTVFLNSCEKRLPVTYAGEARARRFTGAPKKNIPIKLLTGGVMPVIFASTLISLPALIGSLFGADGEWLSLFQTTRWLSGDPWYAAFGFVLYLALIVGFGYVCQIFYQNPAELAENLRKSGASIPGVRAGKPTADYLSAQMKWLTLLGGLFLCVTAAIPVGVSALTRLSSLSFLGTSTLIVVGTVKDTFDAWVAERPMRSYKKLL